MGRSGEQATKHALIVMAQSARSLAKKAGGTQGRRKVYRDKDAGGQYVNNYVKGRHDPQRLFKWMFDGEQAYVPGTWENARKIGNSGLAKRSWIWGLAKLKPMKTGKAIPGTNKVYSILRNNVGGYIKENNLSYIQKAMPAGWESAVMMSAGNKIMALARNKLENKWRREMGLPKWKRGMARTESAVLSKYFLKG